MYNICCLYMHTYVCTYGRKYIHPHKVDLYGFGIMVWEMFTGKLPWADKNYHQMIHTVLLRAAPRVVVARA